MITLCMSETHDQRTVRKMSNKRVYTVEEIENILGISKNTAYALVKSGEFHSVKSNRSTTTPLSKLKKS